MRSKSDQKFLQEYKPLLGMPKWKFILLYGLTWAFFVMLLTLAYEYFFEREQLTVRGLLSNVLLFPRAGIL